MINDYFDKIYIINLPDAQKRRHSIAKEMSEHDINFTFFQATSKTDIVDDYSEMNTRMSMTEVACAYSHFKIYNDIVEKKYSNALILEDDVIIDNNVYEDITKIINNIPNRWDLLYWGGNDYFKIDYRYYYHNIYEVLFAKNAPKNKFEFFFRLGNMYLPYSKYFRISCGRWGAYAYSVTLRFAESLINNKKRISKSSDRNLNDHIKDIRCFELKKWLFLHKGVHQSQIEHYT